MPPMFQSESFFFTPINNWFRKLTTFRLKHEPLLQLLPEYQVAHERAVYKTVAIVADTKKIVQNINLESLAELRAMQKPSIEIEDLMAAIIMIREFGILVLFLDYCVDFEIIF